MIDSGNVLVKFVWIREKCGKIFAKKDPSINVSDPWIWINQTVSCPLDERDYTVGLNWSPQTGFVLTIRDAKNLNCGPQHIFQDIDDAVDKFWSMLDDIENGKGCVQSALLAADLNEPLTLEEYDARPIMVCDLLKYRDERGRPWIRVIELDPKNPIGFEPTVMTHKNLTDMLALIDLDAARRRG